MHCIALFICCDLWALRLHVWIHMWVRLRTCRINPQLNSCFADEDFVRIMCSVVAVHAVTRYFFTLKRCLFGTRADAKSILTALGQGCWLPRCHGRQNGAEAIPRYCRSGVADSSGVKIGHLPLQLLHIMLIIVSAFNLPAF